jgi:hypothetical protein
MKAEMLKFERSPYPWRDMMGQALAYGLKAEVFVIDRFHLSEFVYSSFLKREEPTILIRQIMDVQHRLDDSGAMTFYLYCDEKVRAERQKGRDKPDEIPDDIWQMAKILFRPTPIMTTYNEPARSAATIIRKWIGRKDND